MKDLINETIDKIAGIKNKLIVKWIVAFIIVAITFSYLLGQFNNAFFSRLDSIEQGLLDNITLIKTLNKENIKSHEKMMLDIIEINDNNLKKFQQFQLFNNKQLELIIDYSSENKELLKKMLEINRLNFNLNETPEVHKSDTIDIGIGYIESLVKKGNGP